MTATGIVISLRNKLTSKAAIGAAAGCDAWRKAARNGVAAYAGVLLSKRRIYIVAAMLSGNVSPLPVAA